MDMESSTQGNAGGKRTGDHGEMIALGRKNNEEEYVVSKNNKDIQHLMSEIGEEREEWFKTEFPLEYSAY